MRKTRRGAKTDRAETTMAERKITFQPTPGAPTIEGVDVPVASSQENWSEYTLEDGTIMRIKTVVLFVIRAIGQYDQEGNPLYFTRAQPVIGSVHVPEKLKKKA